MKRAASVAVLMTMTSCWFSHSHPDVTSFTVLSISTSGVATQQIGTGAQAGLSPHATVPLGALVTVSKGSVTLGRGSSTIEIRPSQSAAQATVTLTSLDQVEVGTGFVLASIDQGAPIEISSQDTSASAPDGGVFRFDRLFSIRIGDYDGAVTVTTAEGSLQLAVLQEAVVAGRVLPHSPVPYSIDPADAWDRAQLSDVIALDDALRTQALGYERQTGAHFGSLSLLAPIAKDLNADLGFASGDLASLSRGDVLIGIELAVIVARKQKLDPASAFGALVSQFDAGATWGELAKPYGVVADLRRAVERAIAILFGEVRPSPSPTPSASVSPGPSVSPSPTATITPTPSRSSSPPPPPESLAPPANLTAANGTCNVLQSASVDLAWRASASPNAGGYEVFRAEGGGQFSSLTRVDGRDSTTFTDQTVSFSTAYAYKVRTLRGAQVSGFSNTAAVTTKSNLCM